MVPLWVPIWGRIRIRTKKGTTILTTCHTHSNPKSNVIDHCQCGSGLHLRLPDTICYTILIFYYSTIAHKRTAFGFGGIIFPVAFAVLSGHARGSWNPVLFKTHHSRQLQ